MTTDDEALAAYATVLGDAVEAALPAWVLRCVITTCERAGVLVDDTVLGAAAVAATAASRSVMAELRGLLASDIDEQATTPLSVLRGAVRYPTAVLVEIGVVGGPRDEFAVRAFPDDPYGLSPATFADVDPSLAEPGLVWGAAKAHVHLARRRAAGQR